MSPDVAATDGLPEDRAPLIGVQRRDMLLGGALLGASAAAAVLAPRPGPDLLGRVDLETLLPQSFGEWSVAPGSGFVLPPEDQLRDKVYSHLLTRQYMSSNGADMVMLLIAYSPRQDSTIQIHRPEVCYPASGFEITQWDAHDLRLSNRLTIPGRYMVGEAVTRTEKVTYWTRIGRYFPTNWGGEHISVMRENLRGIVPDGVLVRFSTVSGGDPRPMLDRFAGEMVAAARPLLRRALIGTATLPTA